MVSKYKGEAGGLRNPSLLAELRHTAYLLELDNAATEARHAGIRRSIQAASLHTRTERSQLANAEWVWRRMRAILHPSRPGRRPTASPTSAGKGLGNSNTKRCPGGPWRAFVRQETHGSKGSPDLGGLAEAYKRVPEEEMTRLRARGADVIAAGSLGHKAFGANSREVHRAQRKRNFGEACAMAERSPSRHKRSSLALPGLSGAKDSSALLALQPQQAPVDAARRVREFKSQLRQERAVQIGRAKALDASLVAFEASDTHRQ